MQQGNAAQYLKIDVLCRVGLLFWNLAVRRRHAGLCWLGFAFVCFHFEVSAKKMSILLRGCFQGRVFIFYSFFKRIVEDKLTI